MFKNRLGLHTLIQLSRRQSCILSFFLPKNVAPQHLRVKSWWWNSKLYDVVYNHLVKSNDCFRAFFFGPVACCWKVTVGSRCWDSEMQPRWKGSKSVDVDQLRPFWNRTHGQLNDFCTVKIQLFGVAIFGKDDVDECLFFYSFLFMPLSPGSWRWLSGKSPPRASLCLQM